MSNHEEDNTIDTSILYMWHDKLGNWAPELVRVIDNNKSDCPVTCKRYAIESVRVCMANIDIFPFELIPATKEYIKEALAYEWLNEKRRTFLEEALNKMEVK